MTEEENKLFDMMQLAEEMSFQNWRTLKYLYNEKFREAQNRIEQLESALGKYSCPCTEPCALYDSEKSREGDMPHMTCGWWAKSVLEKKDD